MAATHSSGPTQPWYVGPAELKQMAFPRAAEVWLATRAPYISPKTFHEYALNIRTLSAFFADATVADIGADQIRAYQRVRRGTCGASAVNHECSVLQQMLKRLGLWEEIAPHYEPMPLPKQGPGRVLSSEERSKLFELARTNTNWEAAFLFAMLSVNTTAGPKEIATLRLKDVDLETPSPLIQVQPEGAKNAGRVRAIPLNSEALQAAALAVERARRLGATEPDHYLFPFRIHRSLFDPTRHQTSFKTAWKRMIAAAELPGFRMYDLRHHAITVLLENPEVSEETVESIAGHISRQMKKRYSHIRLEARRVAVSVLDGSVWPLAPEPPRLRAEDPLTNQGVLKMLQDGLLPRIVAETIKGSPCHFDVRAEVLAELQSSGVPEVVILAMIRASRRGKHAV